MKIQFVNIAGMVALMMVGVLCHGQDGTDRKGKRPMPDKGSNGLEEPAFKFAGPRSGIRTPRFVVIHNQAALAELFKEHNPAGEFHAESIDFKKQDVIGYFAGSKPTGGFSVELIGVDRHKEHAVVKFRLLKPGPGAMVIQAFTAPYLIQSIQKLPSKVSHTVTEQERGGR